MALTLPFMTEADYAARQGLRPQTLCPAAKVEAGPPRVFPSQDAAFYGDAASTYDAPTVRLTVHRHVAVRGKSNVLTPPDAVVRHSLAKMPTDILPEQFYQRLTIAENFGTATWADSDPFEVGYLDEAAAFTDAVGFNYAHWLTEVLPRVAMFVRATDGRIPIVIDAALHPNIRRSLAVVAGPDAIVHELGPETTLHVGTLHNVSAAGYVPFKLKRQPVESIGHGVFAPEALQEAVRRLKVGAKGGGARPKLLVRRNAALRQLDNEPEIAEGLIARGFEVVMPEQLTLDEQVDIYSRARMIVGATGAAMANLVFCQPDCPIVVMMMRFRHTAYWYWRRMAAAAGAGPVFHASGAQTTQEADPFHPLAAHQNYRVSVTDVMAAVDAAEAAI